MKSLVNLAVLGASVALMYGCAEDVDTDGGNPGSKSSGDSTLLGGTVYNTGYVIGGNSFDYTIFVNTRRNLEVVDSSVAFAQKATIQVSSAIVEAQLQELKDAYLEADVTDPMSNRRERRYKSRLETPSFWKITPIKAGITTIRAERGNRWESIWEKPEIRTLVVKEYTASQVEIGQVRYENGGGNQACSSCHQATYTAVAGAPPHLLGRVVEIDDTSAAEWVSIGSTKDRTANINHQWSFANDTEKFATIAYLRSKQTPDEAAYTKLLYLEELAETREELDLPPKLSTILESVYSQ